MILDLTQHKNINDIILYGSSEELDNHRKLVNLEYFNGKKLFVCVENEAEFNCKNERIKKQDIKKEDNTLVVFATDDLEKISSWAKEFTDLGMKYISYHFIDSLFKVCVGLASRLGYTEIVDNKGNHIKISNCSNDYDKVFIRYQYPTLSFANSLEIGDISVSDGNSLEINYLGSDGRISIGDNTTFVRTFLQVGKNGQITIGNDCMFSIDTRCFQSDSHQIFDLNSGERINSGKNITIGNHVWIGRNATMLGGFNILDNSIFGSHSVSSSEFGKNLIAAGSPAIVIRDNIIWARDSSEVNSYSNYMQCSDKAGLKYLDFPLGYTYESLRDEII